MGTSRARRRLQVVEPIPDPDRHEPQEPSSSLPAVESREVPQPDSADQADLDARLAGMSVLLRVALGLMKS